MKTKGPTMAPVPVDREGLQCIQFVASLMALPVKTASAVQKLTNEPKYNKGDREKKHISTRIHTARVVSPLICPLMLEGECGCNTI